jgi:hypothetical protein
MNFCSKATKSTSFEFGMVRSLLMHETATHQQKSAADQLSLSRGFLRREQPAADDSGEVPPPPSLFLTPSVLCPLQRDSPAPSEGRGNEVWSGPGQWTFSLPHGHLSRHRGALREYERWAPPSCRYLFRENTMASSPFTSRLSAAPWVIKFAVKIVVCSWDRGASCGPCRCCISTTPCGHTSSCFRFTCCSSCHQSDCCPLL